MRMVIHRHRSGSDKTASASSVGNDDIKNYSTRSSSRRARKNKAKIKDGDGDDNNDDDAQPSPPSSSPASEDDRRYMMLRHSDEDDDEGEGIKNGSNESGAAAAGSEYDTGNNAEEARATIRNSGGAGCDGPTTEEDSKKLSIVSPTANDAIRRIRRQVAPAPSTVIRQVSHHHLPPHASQPFPSSSPHHGRQQHVHYENYQQQQQHPQGGYYNYYNEGGQPHEHHDKMYSNEQLQQHCEAERDDEYSFQQHHHHSTSLSAAPSWGESSTNDSSNILLTRRVGTFDYGDMNSMVANTITTTIGGGNGGGDDAGTTTTTTVAAPTSAASNTVSSIEEGPSIDSSITITNVITPAQISRKSSSMMPQQQQLQYQHYLYPPSSPIRASSLGERREELQAGALPGRTTTTSRGSGSGSRSSPKVEDDEDDDRHYPEYDDPSFSSSLSKKQRKKKNEDEEEEHTVDADQERAQEQQQQPLEDEEEEEELAAEWLPPRRGSSTLSRDSGVSRITHSQDRTPRPSRPPPETDEVPEGAGTASRFAATATTTVAVGSPSSPPIPSGGRVQLVGGDADHQRDQYHPHVVWRDNSWGGGDSNDHPLRQLESASPWSVVSRSRSAESHGSSCGIGTIMGGSDGGNNSEWDPPRPTRHPMVPPPGRPNSVGGQRPLPLPPPPPPSYHCEESRHQYVPYPPNPPPPPYYAWGGGVDYYGREGAGRDMRLMPPPPPPSIQKSSSSLSSSGVAGGIGVHPTSLSPSSYSSPARGDAGGSKGERDTPSTPSSSSLAYLPHPLASAAAEVNGGVSVYPPPPPSYYPSSSYPLPPHASGYFHHPPAQYYPHYPPPPPPPPHDHQQHNYPSHLHGAGSGSYRPYPQPHLSSHHHRHYHAIASSLMAADESPQDPTVHPLLRNYNPDQDGLIRPQFRNTKKAKAPNKTMTATMSAAAASSSASAVVVEKAGSSGSGSANGNKKESNGRIQPSLAVDASAGTVIHQEMMDGASTTTMTTTPPMRRRRRRNPTEKAALAARMAASAAAALRERNTKRAEAPSSTSCVATTGASRPTKKIKVGGKNIDNEVISEEDKAGGDNGGVAVGSGEEGMEAFETVGDDERSPFSEEELKMLGSGDDEDIPAARRAAIASALALRAAAGGSPVEPPKAASEVNFDIANPPLLPIVPPSIIPALSSATQMTENDVLCGRGGGTNSQTGNRRYRALVRDFQPTYLMAKRREKPRMARSVVLIVRNRGGRFLRRDDTDGRLYEVGDEKAEAKTSQALREGLDVRATKTAANTLMSSSGGGTAEGTKKKGSVTNVNHAVIGEDGSRQSRNGSTSSRLSYPTPGYGFTPPQQAGPDSGVIRPPYLGGYDDAYYRSRYPMYEYPHPATGSLPSTMRHHAQYFGGRAIDAVAGAGGEGYHYPTAFGGYVDPRAAYPPSPPRSSTSKVGASATKSNLAAVKTA